MTRIPLFLFPYLIKEIFFFNFQKNKVNARECNQNLKAIQAEMISEQKSSRKVLKPIISVVEHKARWSGFFCFS